MTIVLYVVGVVVMWVLAWGSLSVANVLGGLVVGGFLLWLTPDKWTSAQNLRLRPVAVARLVVFILAEIVKSNVVLTAAVLAAAHACAHRSHGSARCPTVPTAC